MKQKLYLLFRIALATVGILLIANVLYLLTFVNMYSGMIITNILGVFLILWAILHPKMQNYTILRWINRCIYAGGIFMLGMLLFLVIFGQIDTVDYREDAVVVPGAGVIKETITAPLAKRLDRCIAYHEKNPDAWIVVSGGQGPHEDITEALAMERYLTARGVSAHKIIKEERSSKTYQNFLYSKVKLDQVLGDSYRIAVITNGFHIYRACRLARLTGYHEISHAHAGIEWYNVSVSYIREVFGVLKMWALKE